MKRKKLAAGALALAVSITACGCGQVYELTDSERAAVVYYSTYAVTKFNKRQPEGIKDVAALEREMALKEEEEKQKQEQQKQEEKQEQIADDTKQNQDAQTDSKTDAEQKQYVSLNQALQLGGINAVYKKYDITSSYVETDSFMVSPNQGNELLVLYFDLANSGNKTAKCNILSKMPSFRLNVNNKLSVTADTTILLDDLGTYQGNIKAGGKEKAVLLFQVKKGKVKQIKSMELEVTVGDSVSLVKL